MNKDPAGVFGGLLQVCIREDAVEESRRLAKVDIIFFFLGVLSSAFTTYLLFHLGVVV
jgi:hypothetical protein